MEQIPQKPKSDLSIPQILPNLVTIAAICAGLTAIRFAFHGDFEFAAKLILAAAVLDGFDGSLARILKSQSALGAELDSLADFLNFGAAPAILIYAWSLHDLPKAGWVCVLVFAVCCVLRLARFNVDTKSEDSPEDSRFFVGVPAPAGAFLVMLPLFLSFLMPQERQIPSGLICVYTVFVGLLMISRIPTLSLKAVKIYREYVKFFIVGFAFIVAALLMDLWATLILFDLIYFAGMLWSWRAEQKS